MSSTSNTNNTKECPYSPSLCQRAVISFVSKIEGPMYVENITKSDESDDDDHVSETDGCSDSDSESDDDDHVSETDGCNDSDSDSEDSDSESDSEESTEESSTEESPKVLPLSKFDRGRVWDLHKADISDTVKSYQGSMENRDLIARFVGEISDEYYYNYSVDLGTLSDRLGHVTNRYVIGAHGYPAIQDLYNYIYQRLVDIDVMVRKEVASVPNIQDDETEDAGSDTEDVAIPPTPSAPLKRARPETSPESPEPLDLLTEFEEEEEEDPRPTKKLRLSETKRVTFAYCGATLDLEGYSAEDVAVISAAIYKSPV